MMQIKSQKNGQTIIIINKKEYKVDNNMFLIDPSDWDPNWAQGICEEYGSVSEEDMELVLRVVVCIRTHYIEHEGFIPIFPAYFLGLVTPRLILMLNTQKESCAKLIIHRAAGFQYCV